MGNTTSTSAVSVTNLATSVETAMVTRYRLGLTGRGTRADDYMYAYVDPINGVVIEPGRQFPVRRYDAEDWNEISNEKKLVPVRKSLLIAARSFLDYHEQITNEIQRQLAVN